MTEPHMQEGRLAGPMRRRALAFVVLIGCVSLFADMTYEGGRSISGPFLGSLGASAFVVSIVAGLGEFIGYGLRYFSGRAADRSKRYWPIMGSGYVVNLLAIPLLALAGSWPVAMILLIGERAGRAVRSPIRAAMLSHAATRTGAGWGFGLHAALDQTGALIGPLIVAAILASQAGYSIAFATLLAPAAASLLILAAARWFYPDPSGLELRASSVDFGRRSGFARPFWIYLAAASLAAAGFADFALIAFHLTRTKIASPSFIPILYALAMAIEGIGALALGRLADSRRSAALFIGLAGAAMASPLLFFGGFGAAVVGAALWGLGTATQDTIFHALISRHAPAERRATAFGLFDAGRGAAWLVGSAVLGLLYMVSIPALVAFSVAFQLAAVPVAIWAERRGR